MLSVQDKCLYMHLYTTLCWYCWRTKPCVVVVWQSSVAVIWRWSTNQRLKPAKEEDYASHSWRAALDCMMAPFETTRQKNTHTHTHQQLWIYSAAEREKEIIKSKYPKEHKKRMTYARGGYLKGSVLQWEL